MACLGFGVRAAAQGLQEPAGIEPVDPFQGGELDGLEETPGPAMVDHLGLVEAMDSLGQGFVIGVPQRC